MWTIHGKRRYTYCGPNQAFSEIDHFIISRCSMSNNISDHVSLFLDVEWHSPNITNIFDPITDQIPNPLWARATQAQIEHYQSRLDFYLSNIVIPYTALLCKDFSCSVSSHISDLDLFYQNIIDACVFATNDAIPCRTLSILSWLDTGTESCQRTVIVLALYMGCM